MLKRALCMLTTICLLAICFSCMVSAETSWSAVLKVEQTSSENSEGFITVRVSIDDITSKTGIICAMYNLNYDSECLELVSWTNGVPANWDFSESSTLYAEDWSQIITDDGKTYFSYTLMNVAAQDGVKENGVLYTDLKFKVLDDGASASDLIVTEISFVDVDDLVGGTSLDLADKTLALELDGEGGNTSTDVSDETSSEVSEDEVSGTTSQPAVDVSNEETTEGVFTVDILLNNITDPAGVSSLLFHVKYDDKLLEYVSYQCIKPDNWRDDTLDTEDMTPADQINGDLLFWILNVDPACTVKDNGALGFRLTFELKTETPFDPAWLTIEEAEVINGDLQEMAEGTYSISVVQIESNTSEDPVVDDGAVLKIVIAVVAAMLVIGGGVAIWYFVRKKKTR